MARPSEQLIDILNTTADRLECSDKYMWGHMGACNCGHLAQTVTELSREDIHAYAMQRYGDWERQVMDYCPNSGYPFDLVIENLLEAGFTTADLTHLERLNDHEVLRALPKARRHLSRNNKADAVLYLRTWANVLEAKLAVDSLKHEARKPVAAY